VYFEIAHCPANRPCRSKSPASLAKDKADATGVAAGNAKGEVDSVAHQAEQLRADLTKEEGEGQEIAGLCYSRANDRKLRLAFVQWNGH
jgi:hypothetical protein